MTNPDYTDNLTISGWHICPRHLQDYIGNEVFPLAPGDVYVVVNERYCTECNYETNINAGERRRKP